MSFETHRHFHDELSAVKVRLLTMSGEAEAALGLAVEALLERDADKARQVIANDRAIDNMEMEIEEACVNLLALQQPMARDLRMLTSALKIERDSLGLILLLLGVLAAALICFPPMRA